MPFLFQRLRPLFFDLDEGKVLYSMQAQQADTACVAQDRPQFPVCFMTNGGGVTEAEKAEQLSEWLNVTVHADQVGVKYCPTPHILNRFA